MSKISAMLDVGKRSMMNSQTGLQTVGHNIANRSTEGFSRQRVDVQTNDSIGEGKLRIGMGARPTKVSRVNNPYLEKQIEKETAELGFTKGKAEAMSRVEQIFNEQDSKGLNQYMNEFFNAFRELSNNPESLASRTLVRESATFMTQDFKRISTQLHDIQKDIDQQIITHVENVNQMVAEIAKLNEKIQQVEVMGADANDERDRRDLLIKNLGKSLNIKYAEGDGGKVTITSAGVVLVSGYSSRELACYRNASDDGKMHIYYKPSDTTEPIDMTSEIKGGELGGVLNVRDREIEEYLAKTNQLASVLANQVNRAHVAGFDRYNKPGEEFFVLPQNVKNAAELIQLNRNISTDVGKIVAGKEPDAPADNTIARIISNIQYKSSMDEGKATIDDFYNGMVGQIGVVAQRAIRGEESQENIVKQLKNLRESISGVSVDEEMTKMIEYQKSFDASAKLIKAADEMFDTVLSLKR